MENTFIMVKKGWENFCKGVDNTLDKMIATVNTGSNIGKESLKGFEKGSGMDVPNAMSTVDNVSDWLREGVDNIKELNMKGGICSGMLGDELVKIDKAVNKASDFIANAGAKIGNILKKIGS